jgi:hypothetical protein
MPVHGSGTEEQMSLKTRLGQEVGIRTAVAGVGAAPTAHRDDIVTAAESVA